AAGPKAAVVLVEFLGLEVGELEVAPVMQPWALGAHARRQALPVGWLQSLGDLRGGACNASGLAPRPEHVGCINAEHITFACPAQVPLDVTDAVDGIGRDPVERHTSGDGPRDHPG